MSALPTTPRQTRTLRSHAVNWAHLARQLRAACHERHVTAKQAADQMGVHPSALSRLYLGTPMGPDGLASLLAWLNPDDVPSWITGPDAKHAAGPT